MTKKENLGIVFNRRSQAGFTFVEMIVVIGIIGLISFSLFTNYRQGSANALMRTAADDLASTIRRAQAAALSGQLYQGQFMREYRVFVSTVNATFYELCTADFNDGSAINCGYADPPKIIETVRLPRGITISNLNITSIGNVNGATAIFAIPFGELSMNYGHGDPFLVAGKQKLTITLRNTNNSTVNIIVDAVTGRVEVQ